MDGPGRQGRTGLRRNGVSELPVKERAGGPAAGAGRGRAATVRLEETMNDKYIFGCQILTLPSTEQLGLLRINNDSMDSGRRNKREEA